MNGSFNAVDRFRTDGTYHEIHGFFFKEAVPLLFFYNNVSDSGFQVTAFKPCPHMLCRYIHHVINKEHRNPYRISENPAGTIPASRGQTPDWRKRSFPVLHEYSKLRNAGPV
jgi:cytochrome b